MSPSVPSTPALPAERRLRYAARRRSRQIALAHYENFTVVSMVLPRRLRQDFYNIYAFCRHADDLADEIQDTGESLHRLAELRGQVMQAYQGRPTDPILIALLDTIHRYEIPPAPFLALIDAFEQDRRVGRYATFEDVLDYCRRSANPVGHLVLYLGGYRDAQRQQLADQTCTALQLTNFWQDVVPDLARGRIYLPREDMDRFGVDEQQIRDRRFTPGFEQLMRFEVDRTEQMFRVGEALPKLLSGRMRTDVALYSRGGRAILDRIRAAGYNVLAARPVLGKWAKLMLLARTLAGV